MAIKSIRGAGGEAEAIKFREECLLLNGLRHQNLVRLCGVTTDERDAPCMVMELASSGSLRGMLDAAMKRTGPPNADAGAAAADIDGGPLGWEYFFVVGRGVAAGLEFLHLMQVLHLDLKSPNVLMFGEVRPG